MATDNLNVICSICKRQFSKYTCPSCNAPYCSLSCFHSKVHSQCSESFYKKELKSDIQSSPSSSTEEQRKMLELLKKIEEDSIDDVITDFLPGDGNDTDGNYDGNTVGLAKRLENVNLDTVKPDILWSLLNSEERSRFLQALNDPDSELAQQLLASEDLEKEQQRPWWEDNNITPEVTQDSVSHYQIPRPEPILVPSSMVKPVSVSPSLIYNLCAICLAYAYITRRLAISPLSSISADNPDFDEVQRLIAQLIPFLTDKKSTTRFSSLGEVITDLWARFDEGEVTSKTFAVLLRDCARIMEPLHVTFVPPQPSSSEIDPTFHPHYTSSLVLSDLSRLFSQPIGTRRAQSTHICQKLLFYLAHVISTPSRVLRLVASQLTTKSRSLEQEDQALDEDRKVQVLADGSSGIQNKQGLIQKLG